MWTKKGFVMAVDHEPLSFMRRTGYASANQEEKFLEVHKEENIKKLAHNGCDLVRFHYYKGFGLEAEKEEIEMTKEYVRLCHKHGIKVELYTQFGTLQPETFLAERPDMLDWIQVDENGKPITLIYGHQSYRVYPCFNKSGFWDYLEKVIHKGIKEIGGDAIGFDNVSTTEEPVVCHCDSCKKAFRKYLKDKYRVDTIEGTKLARERFGHTVLDFIEPPVWNRACTSSNLMVVNNPVIQEWILFRCESIKKVIQRLYSYCKNLDPNIVLEFNTYKGFGTNTAFVQGLYVPDFEDCIDAFWDEIDVFPEYKEDGTLFHRIRSYKMGQAMGKVVFTGHPRSNVPAATRMLAYAESMAFNHGIVNGIEGTRAIYSGEESLFLPYKEFREKHNEIYDTEAHANVAFYESKLSLAFNNFSVHYANIVMYQGLIRGHAPFDNIYKIEDIDKYKTVILPNVECISNEEMESIKAFVSNGGGIIMTDDTGKYDQWHRAREDASLLNELGINANELKACEDVSKFSFGLGRVVYIKKLRCDNDYDLGSMYEIPELGGQFSPQYWHSPLHLKEIIEGINWASHETIPLQVEAPEYVALELKSTQDMKATYLHLINYKPHESVKNVKVKFQSDFIGNGYEMNAFIPDSGEEHDLKIDDDGWISIPEFQCYCVICIKG